MTVNHTTVVIGAGHAGSQCAVSLRQEGYVGSILLIDGESHDLPYHKPPLSKSYIKDLAAESKPLRPESAYAKANVVRQRAVVSAIDCEKKSIQLENGDPILYDTLVLATGAYNRQLPTLKDCSNVHSLRTLADAERLREQLSTVNAITILGGGFIGLETAASLVAMDKTITVIEGADRVLSRVCSESISHRVQHSFSQLGVTVHTQQMASDFVIENNKVKAITLSNQKSIECDLLLVGIGAIANTQLAEQAGLVCDEGVQVSANLLTSDPNVYAIGDCARYPHWQSAKSERLESVQNAVDQAKFVAASIANNSQNQYKTVPWFWSDIGSLKLQIAGLRLEGCESFERSSEESLAIYHLQNQRVICVESINSPQDHLVARKLIGTDSCVSPQDIAEGPTHLKSLLQ